MAGDPAFGERMKLLRAERGVRATGGRPRKGTALTDLLRATLDVAGDDGVTHKQAIVNKQIERARAGAHDAITWIFDRIDGPIPRPVELSGKDGGPVEHAYRNETPTAVDVAERAYLAALRAEYGEPDSLGGAERDDCDADGRADALYALPVPSSVVDGSLAPADRAQGPTDGPQ